MLFDYLKQVQRFCRDAGQILLEPQDLIGYVNRARREIAGRTQCVRILPNIYGAISTVTVTAPGTGYAPGDTFTFSPPDSPSGAPPDPSGRQATGALVVGGGGTIDAINVTDGGAGYFQPTGSITTSTGSGCTFSIQVTGVTQTVANQEVYRFSDIDLSPFPGVGSIITVRNISVIYSNYRYSLLIYPWTTYESMIRQYPRQYYYVPIMGSQFGQGANGSFYFYPVASQAYQTEWDCGCLPSDLTSDLDPEAIPLPWTDAVPYFAAHLAFLELQNLNAAQYYLQLYEKMTSAYSSYARGTRIINPYGRYVLPFLLGAISAVASFGHAILGAFT